LRSHLRRVDPIVVLELFLNKANENEEVRNKVDEGDDASRKCLGIITCYQHEIRLYDSMCHCFLALFEVYQYENNHSNTTDNVKGDTEEVLLQLMLLHH